MMQTGLPTWFFAVASVWAACVVILFLLKERTAAWWTLGVGLVLCFALVVALGWLWTSWH